MNAAQVFTLVRTVPLRWLLRAGVWLAWLPLRPFRWAARRPIVSTAIVGSVLLVVLAEGWLRLPAATGLVVAVLVWRRGHPASFAAVRAWVLGGLRASLVYRWRWRRHLTACGLAQKNRDGDPVAPRLIRVLARPGRDELRVRLLPGQTPDLFTSNVVALAHSFKVGHSHPEYIARITARCHKSGTVTLVFPRADPLVKNVQRFTPAPVAKLDLEAVPVAGREDGATYRMPVLYTHILVAGASGSGKGSVLWSAMNGIASGIPSGLVQPWGVDPKGGMELALGKGLFARLAYDRDDTTDDRPSGDDETTMAEEKAAEMVTVVEELADLARARASRLAGVSRKHVPTVAEPFIPLFVDELAFLTAYMPYSKLKQRFNQALGVLLSQGRAVGVSVIAFVQDPRKEIVALRNLFQLKIGLRLDTEEESGMVLGKAAVANGGHCEAIPPSTQGVGYALIDGNPNPYRVRFSYITDDDIADLVRTYPSPGVERTRDGHLMPPAPPHLGELHAVPDCDNNADDNDAEGAA